MVSPVNASRQPSRTAAHHSGPERLARPYCAVDFHLLSFADLSWRSPRWVISGLLRAADVRSALGGKDAMRLKDAASSSFDCFHIDLKERHDDTDSSIDLPRTLHLCGSGVEQEQLALGDPVGAIVK